MHYEVKVNNTQFYSNGKLLLTGEYVVLDGALSLALPTQYGQSLIIKPLAENKITWKSLDDKGNVWFEENFLFQNGILKQVNQDNEISNRLFQILQTAKQLNPDFLNNNKGFEVESILTFPKEWGLGSSSTLINNIAHWAKVDAYKLLELTFGGSGYDIACAKNDFAITYQLKENKQSICKVEFNPEFKESLYFVYLNKKQNSREGIERYKKNTTNLSKEISEISNITSKIIDCKLLNEFESLLNKHEAIISNIINQQPVKERLFKDFKGSIKSLGAWGGDFILATSKENPTDYFKSKGFETIIPYSQMIKT
jgi:mevalonate kinase